ncbi:DUF3883 domain-containing protein [Haloplanus aerogenes]|uniref:DUF3883 domain-containing protein n=1 Tax=Haloplanus aerogenes TaxID=660522 RepID=A0A3M0D9U2_9EURY|nr:DUF3883 domain-containing protein [Haloplanus aerogenes]AZH26360.1 DUF3883 domain-containing protein [Haloplanus aerogenes]RMB18177.1 uncharacterized protein DUF3883 [Haloplanus aerogenes]
MTRGLQKEGWEEWLREQRSKMEDVYRRDPDRIFSDYTREAEAVRGYSGRGMLELIQNADDAGRDYAEPVDLLIELTDQGLFVANTGAAFTPEGVSSLILSDNSPKQFRKDCIGYKGLGFRSVLNWASRVVVHSGDVSIGFSEAFASAQLERLREDDEIDAKARRFEKRGIATPIATLSTPHLLSNGKVDDPKLREVYNRGCQLRTNGYDTVIGVPLPEAEQRAKVQREIDALFEEITLFLRNIGRIRIRSDERDEEWRVNRTENAVTIHREDGDSVSWQLFEESGEIPSAYRRPSQTEDKYEIKIAVPEDLDRLESTSNLFVFFPTKVSFPFPMLAHATFEVTENRDHLTNSETNRFVATKLASLMVNAAEEKKSIEDPWAALRTVSSSGEIGSTLEELESIDGSDTFDEMLRMEASSRALIPVQNGTFTTPDCAYRISGNFDDLLHGERFDDICLHVNNAEVDTQLEKLDVQSIGYDDLKRRINEIASDLSLETRATLIARLVDEDIIEDESPPALLIDSDRATVDAGTTVFLPPQDDAVTLPEWIPQRILHPELAAELRERWNLRAIRDLRMKLSAFGVREYNLSGLVQSVSAEANRRVKDDPDAELEWRMEMLEVLWKLYQLGVDGVNLSNIPIEIPTRTGTVERADSLYLTAEYPNGDLVEQLYGPVDPSSFVADPEQLPFSDDRERLEDFLCWLGVAHEPRIERVRPDDPAYHDYVVDSLEYPARFEALTKESAERVSGTRSRLTEVQTVDRLAEVLTHADPHAILAWLTTIGRTLDEWRQEGDIDGAFEIKPQYKQYWRTLSGQSIPSHPLWLLKTSAWLPTENGEPQPPQTCSTAEFAREISPLIGYPTIEMAHPLLEGSGIDETAVVTTLRKIGVTSTITDLSWDAFYRILSELPERDPAGEVAPRVYRTLYANKDGTPPAELYGEFVDGGEMLGIDDGTSNYYPVTELRYADSESIPTPITDEYPLLALDKRRGVSKVEQLFGVKGLSTSSIDISNIRDEPHPQKENFEAWIDDLKPFVYALRVDSDDDLTERNTIRDLEIVLCRSVTATASVGGDEFEITLSEGEFLPDGSRVFLIPESVDSYQRLRDDRLARLIGDVFADILDVDIGREILYLTTANDRVDRLGVLLGDDAATERLRNAVERLDREVRKDTFPEPTAPDPEPVPEPEQTQNVTEEQETEAGDDGDNRQAEPNRITGITAEEGQLDPISGQTISIRRVGTGTQEQSSGGSRRTANPGRAETIAARFEEHENRFPLPVAHIQGNRGYGCDVLSFESQEDRSAFKSDPDVQLIDRHIEVKGSTSRKGAVTLSDNELAKAREQGDDYYLYRVYEGSTDSEGFELVILRNPLAHGDAVETKVEVNPHRTDQGTLYRLDVTADGDDEERTK